MSKSQLKRLAAQKGLPYPQPSPEKGTMDVVEAPKGTVAEFCKSCGASFPPRYGEGTCVDWVSCFHRESSSLEPS